MRIKLSDDLLRRKLVENAVLKEDTNCWIWTKCLCAGYGCIFNGFTSVTAHKLSFELFKGKIPSSAVHTMVLHKCGNRKCINPDHLYLGTKQDNTYDALRHGAYSDRFYLHKKDVEFICYLFSNNVSKRTIAKMYLSSHTRINRILKEQSNYNELLEQAESIEALKRVREYRTVKEMKKEGYKNKEIAEQLNKSMSKIKRIARGEYVCAQMLET